MVLYYLHNYCIHSQAEAWFLLSSNYFLFLYHFNFFLASAKRGILTPRPKTIEVVYVSFFEPTQLALVCKFQLWL